MPRFIAVLALALGSAACLEPPSTDSGTDTVAVVREVLSPSREIDTDVYAAFVSTVAAGDIAGMGEIYFPAAVVVSPRGTVTIAEALDRWGQDMAAAKAKGQKAVVEFRFALRLDDSATAFDSGIFKFTVVSPTGTTSSDFVPFEYTLAKTNGRWRVLMERALPDVTEEAWDKLPS